MFLHTQQGLKKGQIYGEMFLRSTRHHERLDHHVCQLTVRNMWKQRGGVGWGGVALS